jgi:hypothetical protein
VIGSHLWALCTWPLTSLMPTLLCPAPSRVSALFTQTGTQISVIQGWYWTCWKPIFVPLRRGSLSDGVTWKGQLVGYLMHTWSLASLIKLKTNTRGHWPAAN